MFGGAAPAGASAITKKGSATAAADSISIPSHATDDTILMFARTDTASSITVPAGWTTIQSNTSGSYDSTYMYSVCAYKKAASGSEVSGTWTNAGVLICEVYDGVSSIGGSAKYKNSSAGYTVYWPAVTMSDTSGKSWVAGLVSYRYTASTGWDSSPAGMTKRSSYTTYPSFAVSHDTASGAGSWTLKSTTIYTSANFYTTFTIELVSE